MVYFGTSGFSFRDWVGSFYPSGMPKREWLTYCARDNTCELTTKIGYVRFHGRNSAKWWQHEQAYERDDSSYTSQEPSERMPKIQKLDSLTEKTFVFANNHWPGQAANTIRQLRTMLE